MFFYLFSSIAKIQAMLSMAGSGLEAGAGTSKGGDAAESCERGVHPGTRAWGAILAVASRSARNGGVIRAAQITVSEPWAASDETCASVLGGFEHPLVCVEGWECELGAVN